MAIFHKLIYKCNGIITKNSYGEKVEYPRKSWKWRIGEEERRQMEEVVPLDIET